MTLHVPFVRPIAPDRLTPIIGPERAARFAAAAAAAGAHLTGRTVFNVNSTAVGGGVAEMLQTLLASARGVGVDTRWLVIEGNSEFFAITKRIHNGLYGRSGDGGELGPEARRQYEATLAPNARDLLEVVGPRDFVLLHDPQTAGLAPALHATGARIVWRCHVGLDHPDEHADRAWAFLRPYLDDLDAYVFSSARFAPDWVPRDRLAVIPPSIDPFSAKNEHIDTADVARMLAYVGMLDGPVSSGPAPTFSRRDGAIGRVSRPVDLLGTGPPPPIGAPVVLQASRWDSLKDMPGVMDGFATYLEDCSDAHLVLAGPSVQGVTDDPEAGAIVDECIEAWGALPPAMRSRIHLACMPMDDPDEAAAVVNALQRYCTVAVQKSLAEGFGLTVAEAMWKSRPVVASAVGGIIDQVVDHDTGLLVTDPYDLTAFAATVAELLRDPEGATRMGENGRRRAVDLFLGDRHLQQWAELIMQVDETAERSVAQV